MADTAQPRPLREPLPGGSEGAEVGLHPLLVAHQKAPRDFLVRPRQRLADVRGMLSRRGDWQTLPIVAFLVEHPTAGPIVVDTAFDASVATDPAQSLGRLGARLYASIDMTPEQAVPAQLRARGVDPADVQTVVMTHLHYDHASGVRQFPEATFVVSSAEWAAASSGGALDGYRPAQFNENPHWRTIDFERTTGVESFATFGNAFDLFGDGSVRLVFTPGHTKGHLSLVLRLAGGREALLCGDAAYARVNIERRAVPMLCRDEHRYLRSLDEIRRYEEQTPDALVIPGHDLATWSTLEPSY